MSVVGNNKGVVLPYAMCPCPLKVVKDTSQIERDFEGSCNSNELLLPESNFMYFSLQLIGEKQSCSSSSHKVHVDDQNMNTIGIG